MIWLTAAIITACWVRCRSRGPAAHPHARMRVYGVPGEHSHEVEHVALEGHGEQWKLILPMGREAEVPLGLLLYMCIRAPIGAHTSAADFSAPADSTPRGC